MIKGAGSLTLRATQAIDWVGAPPAGATLGKVFIGPDPDGLGGIQVAVATVTSTPTVQLRQRLHALRKGSRAITLVVAVTDGTTAWLQGPDASTAWDPMPVDRAARQLQSVLDEQDSTAAFNHLTALRRQVEQGGVGWINNGLFAKYHLEHNVPGRPDWGTHGERASRLRDLRGQRLIEALGFTATTGPGGSLILTATDGESEAPRAVLVVLDESEHFDAKSPRYQLTPIAFALAVAQRRELPWVIGLRKDHIRLYPGKDGVGVGQKGQVETFFEIDLAAVDDAQAAFLTLIFSAAALAKGGATDDLLRQSANYATGLGNRLRQRIYEDVVPPIAKAVAERLPSLGLAIDADGLQAAYKLTLRILFRLLFQAYAEDRGLLPYERNEGYTSNSLKRGAQRNLGVAASDFGDSASIWLDLVQVWNAIDQGNRQWQVPAYNGGLFAADPARSDEGGLLARLSLPDSVLGPALQHLMVDLTPEGTPGLVDFRALSVREFGTIYEGLLESSLSIADADLTTDRNGAWVPATKGDTVEAEKGSVYFHGASGERKATGSYFTPKVVVDHLIERSIVPALTKHLDTVAAKLARGKQVTRQEFFDFRVADLAMGSGHFLVAAVDKIEALMRTFLAEHDVPDVRDELLKIAGVARQALGDDEVAKSEVEEIGLLRRQVARRCIYGLDINPLAVELARLAIWIHTFVPGLPMSNLDHGLVCANSLTGIGTIDEAINSLVGAPQGGRGAKKAAVASDGGFDFEVDAVRLESGHQLMVRRAVTDYLKQSLPLLADVANASEASKTEVQEAAALLAKAKAAAEPASRIFDAAVAVRLGEWSVSITKEEHVTRLVETTEPTELVADLHPAHMPALFPEVFLRDKAGFDVLLGNPPWETVKVEEQKWWWLRFPGLGLRRMAKKEQKAVIASLRYRRPDLVAEYEAEVASVAKYSRALNNGQFVLGSGDTDLYQVFAWRYWQLLRPNGRAAVVLPRPAVSGSPLEAWRREVLTKGAFASVCMAVNNGHWVFEEPVHASKEFAFTVVERSGEPIVRFAGPFASESDFLARSGDLAEVPANEFATWSDVAAFPLMPDSASATVFRRMQESPMFDSMRPGWDFRLTNELHSTNDAELYDFDLAGATGVPIYKGESFNHWEPDSGIYYARADAAELRKHLLRKLSTQTRQARSPYFGLDFAGGLPMDRPRIAFRKITSNTNQRTCVSALIPGDVSATEGCQVILRADADAAAEAFLLGVLSSIPFDWAARRWVEINFNFYVMKSLPVPVYEPGTSLADRAVHVAGSLAAVDGRYREWAAEVGVEVGTAKDEPVKSDLIAELDALVSLLYGLTEEQVRHVFATFHRGWDYQGRLNAVLAHYARWKEAA